MFWYGENASMNAQSSDCRIADSATGRAGQQQVEPFHVSSGTEHTGRQRLRRVNDAHQQAAVAAAWAPSCATVVCRGPPDPAPRRVS
jgi:hypothetical protein